MKKTIIVLASLISAACTTLPEPFKITSDDTRFESGNVKRFTGENNRLSKKSVAGGIHVDTDGLYINPTVTKTESGAIKGIFLSITHQTERGTIGGNLNLLGAPKEITFLADNKPIKLQIFGGNAIFGSPRVSGSHAYTPVMEVGTAPITKEQLTLITNSKTLAVKISGTLASATYENADISPDFRKNLNTFSTLQLSN